MVANLRVWVTMVFGILPVMILLALVRPAIAQSAKRSEIAEPDRTLAPFFYVQSADPETDPLPLKSTHADVRIVGVIADVKVTQVYKNEGRNTLEAIYVFPASTRAAVYAMRMTIGARVIEAEIMERKKAREAYEQAKQEGQTASLLEQQRPNVFQMNVANILPGDEIRVELNYTELIEPEETVYEFVLPAVVGPRYSTTPAAGAPDTEKWVENPYLHAGEAAPYTFGLNLDIQTGIPIAQLTSPSHQVSIEYSGRDRAHLVLEDDRAAGTRDFVLRYKLAGGRIQTGILLYPGPQENFFLLMMEPPKRVTSEAVVRREYIFIVDVSGSMHGFPIQVAKRLMRDIITGLGSDDLMNVLLFAGSSAVLSPDHSLAATEENKNRALAWINAQRGGGGTNILPALRRALGLPRTEGVSRIVVVVTDGYVSVEPQAFELIRKNLGRANLFAFGIGSSVNRHLVEGMARVGRGEPFVVLSESEAARQAGRFRRYIQSPVFTDIRVEFEGMNVYDVEPSAVPDLFASRPVVLFGKYRGEAAGEVIIRGRTASGDHRMVILVSDSMLSPENEALRLLWARHRIMRLSDLNHLRPDDERVKEVTALGLKHSLMTAYTSFVAVDKVRRADGEIITVKQPLPLPTGVSDLAVGGRALATALPASKMAMLAPPSATERMTVDAPVATGEPEAREKSVTRWPVEVLVVEVRGDLAGDRIEKALEKELGALNACYSSPFQRRPQIRGESLFRLSIDAHGRVKEVKVVRTALQDASVVDCLKKKLMGIRFPRPGRGVVEVTLKVVCGAGHKR